MHDATTEAAQPEERMLDELRRKIVNGRLPITIDDREFLFRVPGVRDMVALDGCLPVLGKAYDDDPDDATERTKRRLEEVVRDPARAIEVVERAEAILRHLALRPRLVPDDQVDLADDEAPLGAIADSLKILAAHILIAASNAMSESVLGIRPTSGDASSSSSTPSPAGTDASPASSSSEPRAASSPASSG